MSVQEPDPPDVRTAVHATVELLWDTADLLSSHERTQEGDAALLVRVLALRDALIRLREHLDRSW